MFFIYSFKLTSPDDIIDTLHTMGLQLSVNSFSTRLLSSCTDEYAHTYTKQDQDREKAFSHLFRTHLATTTSAIVSGRLGTMSRLKFIQFIKHELYVNG